MSITHELCTVCQGILKSHIPEARDPLTGEQFAVFTCSSCGLGHTMPQPLDLGRYYGARYYGNRHSFTRRHCMRRRIRYLAAVLPGGRGKRLLDVGCGDGSFLLEAKQGGFDVVGTELDPAPGRRAGLDVREDIAQVTGRFDCITMWHTLEHMRDIPSVLSHADRLLHPQGKLIIAVPDFGGWQARMFKERWLHLDVPRHLYHLDAGSLSQALGSCGFDVQRKWYQEFEYDLLGWSQSLLNYFSPHPNVFYNAISGKNTGCGRFATGCSSMLGVLLTLLAFPLMAAGTVAKRGGSLVVVAGRAGR